MNIEQARAFCQKVWPKSTIDLITSDKGTRSVIVDGATLGRGFSWEGALKEACKPVLEAEHRKQVEAAEKKIAEDAALFDEFEAWKKTGHPELLAVTREALALLRNLNNKGGLGVDVHEAITTYLASVPSHLVY